MPTDLHSRKSTQVTGGTDADSLQEVMKYSPGEFVIPASDSKGQTERVFCRLPPMMKREISAIVQQRRFPFRTEGEVMRWCIKNGLEMLAQLEPSPGFLARAKMHMLALSDADYWQTRDAWLDRIDKSIQMHSASGSRTEVLRIVLDSLHKAKKIEEDVWRNSMVKAIMERWGHILNGQE